MKKDFKRILAVIISVIMLLQPVAFAASVLDFPDFPTNDWSTEAMTAAVENGLYIGDENNLIKPDAYLTRAEFSAFVVRAFGATVKADISRYTDVKESDWFHDDIAKANNMGALNGTGETTFSPENKITRQEVFVAIARILCVTSGNIAVIDKFSDSSDVAPWAQANIAGLIEYGYINGYPDGTLKPLEYITRAEIAQLFHNMFKTYIGTAGYHSEVAPVGSVIIRGPGVHLENVTINGDLIIADGVGAGDFNLTSVTVLGRIVARGGEGIVTFKSVSVRDGVFIFDNNGTVNFNNYRTDPPFVKLTEYTPATFLKDKEPEPSSGRIIGGGGGGNYKYYNVNFYKDPGDAEPYAYKRVRSGMRVAAPAGPEKEGHEFSFWGDRLGNRFDFNTLITADRDLYAYYTVNKYTVNYYDENGTTVLYTREVDYNTLAEKLAVPEKPNHHGYWSGTKNGATEFDFTKPIKGDTKLYAVYVEDDVTYTVKYYDEDGNFLEEKTVGAAEGFKAENIAIPEMVGSEAYWSLTQGGEPFDFNTVLNSDIELHRVYRPILATTYTITYYNEDGTAVIDTKEINEGDKAENLDIPEVDGYNAYWSEEIDGDTPFDFNTAPAGNVNLYRVYKLITYTVIYKDEDGNELETKTVNYGGKAEELAIPDKADYDIKYWSEAQNGDDAYDFTQVLEGDLVLYRVYKKTPVTTYTIKYYNEDGSELLDTKTINAGEKAEELAIPDKADYDIKYWSETVDGDTAFDFDVAPTGDVTLYRVYKQTPVTTYTIKYYNEDGSELLDTKTINAGEKAEELDIPDKAPFEIKYWSEEIDGDTEFDFDVAPTGDVTLYRVYKMSQYTVRFYNETNDPGEELVKELEVDKGSTVPGDEFPEESITWTGFERNSDIARIYGTLGIDDVHEIVAEWYYKETADGDWILFDDTVAVNRDIDVYANIKMATVVLTAPDYSTVPFTAEVPYNSTIRAMDSFKDFIFINEGVARQAYNAAEEKVLQKLVDKGLLDNTTDKNILNQHRYVRFVKILGKDAIDELIDRYSEDEIAAHDPTSPETLAKIAIINEFGRQLKNESKLTVNSENTFIFDKVLVRAQKYTFDYFRSRIPAKAHPYLPMDAVEALYNRFYNKYMTELEDAITNAKNNPGTDYLIDAGIRIDINPISDLFGPALEYALSVKPIIEGNLTTSSEIGTYYHYYEENPYKDSYEQFMTVDTWFDGADNGYMGVESGYSLKSFDEYYAIAEAFADLLDDGLSWFYDDANVPEADREAVFDVEEARILSMANFINNTIVDYATNGLPTTLEEIVDHIETDPYLRHYLQNFGLDAYLDEVLAKANMSYAIDAGISQAEERFGAKVEKLLDKYVASRFNRLYDAGEYNKAKETLHGLLTKKDGEFYTVDTLFDLYVKGDYKSVTKKNITVEVSRAWLID